MSRENYISRFEINRQKVIDYIFHNIPKNEEYLMDDFFDNNEELAATVEELLDFCLEHQFNHFMVLHFSKTGKSTPLNNILNDIDYYLEDIQQQRIISEKQKATVIKQDTSFKKLVAIGTKVFGKKITKALFTLLLVLNFWQTGGNYTNSNLLKASQKEEIKEVMTLTDYQVRYMRVDMLDDRPITDFMTDVAIPSNFEMHYFTED
ncbi:MAG: hypothetical protein AB8G11_00405 [Saprospiraceae bacterium]